MEALLLLAIFFIPFIFRLAVYLRFPFRSEICRLFLSWGQMGRGERQGAFGRGLGGLDYGAKYEGDIAGLGAILLCEERAVLVEILGRD